jgi:hypothetical protein
MTRAKLLATSILASTALLGAAVATQAATHAPQTGPRQVAVEQSTQGATAPPAQAAKPALMAQDDGADDRNGVADNGNDDHDGVEDDGSDDHNGVEDDGSDDHEGVDDNGSERGQTGEHEGGQTGEHEGEHED